MPYVQRAAQQVREPVERPLRRRIAQRGGGIGVRLDEEPVRAGGRGREQQGRNHVAMAPADAPGALPWLLHGMGRVVHDRHAGRLAHAGEAAHVDHEVAIPEERAPLGERHIRAATGAYLLHRAEHGLGLHPLPLLHVHRPPRTTRREEQIGLAAEERRDLEDIYDLCDCRRMGRLVDVGEERQAARGTGGLERAEALLETRAAGSVDPRAVGLVEAGLQTDRQSEVSGNPGERLGDAQERVPRLDDAGAGEQKGRVREAPGAQRATSAARAASTGAVRSS
jgi:hypothetical protein